MKKIFFVLAIILCQNTWSQYSLNGTIMANSIPISDANIHLEPTHLEQHSSAEGKFEFRNLKKGNYTITVFFVGYETVVQTVDLSEDKTLNINLVEKPHQMDEVVVFSTPFNKIQSENVTKIEHQTLKALQQKGAITLAQGLATLPGVSQVSTGISIGKPVIRGLSGNRVLVYNQGVRLENQQFGEEHGLGMNDTGIESVEVIKGPASLLYGSDALGGVLYFNPEKFAKPNTFNLRFGSSYFSNTKGQKHTAIFKTSSENVNFLASFNQNKHQDYKTGRGERVENSRFNEVDFKTALGFTFDKWNTVFRYNYNQLHIGLPKENGEEHNYENSFNLLNPKQKVIGQILSNNTVIFIGKSKLNLDLGFIDNDRQEFEDSETAALNMKLKTYNYTLRFSLPKMNNIETIVGIQGMYQNNTNRGEEWLIPNADTRDFGAFVTSLHTWKKQTLQAGLRFDNRFIEGNERGVFGEENYFAALNKKFSSFNASLSYKKSWKSNLVSRINLATGFRAPNLAELSSNGIHEGSNRYETGNQNLKTEQNIQLDINVEYRNPHFELFVNGFYNHLNHYIYLSPRGTQIDTYNVYDYTQNNARLYGGEAGIHLHPHPLDWLHITSSFESVTGKQQNGNYLPLIPANRWNSVLKIDFKNKNKFKDSYLSFSTEYNLKQNKISPFETPTAAYFLVNIGAGTQINLGKATLDIFVNGNNIFDENYISHLSRLKPDGIANMGRNVAFGVVFGL